MNSPTVSNSAEISPAALNRSYLDPERTSGEASEERATVIQLDQVGVRYHVAQERIPTFKEYTIRWVKGQVRYHDFWALHNVSLEVKRGEVFGIIGPNGAGKSTLLKVVARVLQPSRGRVRVYGRVAPLLELGAGFDAELTGRENIYLNGTLLGFTRQQIYERFDSIVEFSGLGDFINAPLRTYSSGMFARLGFSVATAERPDVLIVDEILGVGDAEFQTKSYERIQGFQTAGTTILLVSHSLERVEELCGRALWLEHGQLQSIGSASAVIAQYTSHTRDQEAKRLATETVRIADEAQAVEPVSAEQAAKDEVKTGSAPPTRWGTRKIEIVRVRISGEVDQNQTIFTTGESFTLSMDYISHEPITAPVYGIAIHRQDGAHITGPNTAQAGRILPTLSGSGTVTYHVPHLPLLEGLYYVSVAVVNQDDTEIFDYHDRLYPFRVINQNQVARERFGIVTLGGKWNVLPPLPGGNMEAK
jgi:lipopolysaccharide transport system ATP-binding protein